MHNNSISFASIKVIINLVSMQIVIIFHKFSTMAIKYIKIFYFQLLKIYLNIILKTIVFDIYSYILIEPIYFIFIKDVMVNYFKIYVIIKNEIYIGFEII